MSHNAKIVIRSVFVIYVFPPHPPTPHLLSHLPNPLRLCAHPPAHHISVFVFTSESCYPPSVSIDNPHALPVCTLQCMYVPSVCLFALLNDCLSCFVSFFYCTTKPSTIMSSVFHYLRISGHQRVLDKVADFRGCFVVH